MTLSLGSPPPPTSDFDMATMVGHTVIICVGGCHPAMQTRFGIKPVIRAAIIPLNGDNAGKEYIDVLIFNSRVVRQLRSIPGQAIVAQVVLDPTSTQGAIILEEASEEMSNYAAQWVAAYPGRVEDLIKTTQDAFAVEETKAAQPQQMRPPPPRMATPTPSAPPPLGPHFGQSPPPPPSGGPPLPPKAPGLSEPPF